MTRHNLRDTCYECEKCHGCFKHWKCGKRELCKGTIDLTCTREPRKHKIGVN